MTQRHPQQLLRYSLPVDFDPHKFQQQLVVRFERTESETQHLRCTFLDTFDWRLYAKKLQCCYVTGESQAVIRLENIQDESVIASAPATAMPRLTRDIEPGVLARRLRSICAIRALLPLLTLDCQQHTYHIKNTSNKIIYSIVLLECEPVKPSVKPSIKSGSKTSMTPFRLLYVRAVKGYPLPLDDLTSLLEQQLKLKPLKQNLLQQLTPWLAYPPGSHSGKFKPALDKEQPAQLAAKTIFSELLDTIEQNENGVLHDLDTEFLHDFRVAIRRTRSGLKHIKQVLPEPRVKRFDKEFSWLAGNTGRLRDLDVLLLKFEQYKAMLSSSLRPHLDPLHAIVSQQRIAARQQVCKTLHTKRYASLKQAWRKYLTQEIVVDQSCPLAREPIIDVARTDIWHAFQRIIKRGDKIRADSPAEDYHRLRKTCKQLRYLVEFFQSLFPAGEIKSIRKKLSDIQELLGEFQDLSVQITELHEYTKGRNAEMLPAQTLVAVGALIEKFEQRRREIRAHYEAVFHEFYSKENAERYEALFHPRE